MAKALQRPPREGVTPLVLEKVGWAGANLGSYQQAVDALALLAEIPLAPKQVQRMTSQVGADAVEERTQQVQQHRRRPLMKRTTARPGVESSELAVVMMDGGRFQRRDHFQERRETPLTAIEQTLPPAAFEEQITPDICSLCEPCHGQSLLAERPPGVVSDTKTPAELGSGIDGVAVDQTG